jgi:hypothetical protein
MKQSSSRIIVKNIVVAATLGVAAIAAWAVTQSNAPVIEAVTSTVQHG